MGTPDQQPAVKNACRCKELYVHPACKADQQLDLHIKAQLQNVSQSTHRARAAAPYKGWTTCLVCNDAFKGAAAIGMARILWHI